MVDSTWKCNFRDGANSDVVDCRTARGSQRMLRSTLVQIGSLSVNDFVIYPRLSVASAGYRERFCSRIV